MSATEASKPRPVAVAIVFLLLTVLPVAGLLATRSFQGPDGDAQVERMHVGMRLVVGVFLSVFGSIATIGSYCLVLFTTCFTFRFDRPVYSGFKKRLWIANLAVPVVAMIAATGAVDSVMVAGAFLLGRGAPPWLATIVPALILVNVGTSLFGVWSSVETRLIDRRLAAQGMTRQQLRTGLHLGISDPTRRDWTKAVLEDDVGMLWIEPGRLRYRGDVDEFELTPRDVLQVERVVVGSNLSAHLGVRHIVLQLAEGRRIRLYVEGHWSMASLRRATDRLAERLVRWQTTATRTAAAATA
jgi:hypothetical protein